MPGRHRLGRPVWLVAVLASLLRVPYMHAPMSPDEGGFLVVAQHWHSGGGSLYGPYWVDRPPLLIALFRLADLLGGFTALRVIGCVAVAVAVVGVGLAAAAGAPDVRVARRASVWASIVAAALLVTPTGGAVMVNGELLATPFIAFGIAFTIRAVRGHQGWIGPRVSAVLAGVCAVAAAMVKQNMIDVVVFAAVLELGVGPAPRGAGRDPRPPRRARGRRRRGDLRADPGRCRHPRHVAGGPLLRDVPVPAACRRG